MSDLGTVPRIDELVDTDRYPLGEAGSRFHDRFTADGYVRLDGFLSPAGVKMLVEEVDRLRKLSVRREFAMAEMEGSPRRMSTIGGEVLAEESAMIAGLYGSEHMFGFLSAVLGEPLFPVADPVERHVLNFLHESGDTHGAHFDDHAVAIILFLETPPPGRGGLLEYLPNAARLSDLGSEGTRWAEHYVGDAYVLRSDTTAHRVTPLTGPGRRTAMNFAYATAATADLRSPSAAILYSRE
ncbi:MAG: hypothetical protein AB1673_10680 [Actinomycetota bacterium]|jgi:hypothetical protein